MKNQPNTLKRPNFFLVGAQKSGTTSLYYYLKQHPEIFLSQVKEPNYFCNSENRKNTKSLVQSYDDLEYHGLFDEVIDEKIIGEASTMYLYDQYAAKQIYNYNSESKILMTLRNPYDAAYSSYIMSIRSKSISSQLSFLDVLKKESLESMHSWHPHNLMKMRFYDLQVARYLELFPRSNILILRFEEFMNLPKLLRKILVFLDVDPDYTIDLEKAYFVASTKQSKFKKIIPEFLNLVPQLIRDQLDKIIPKTMYNNYMTLRMNGFIIGETSKLKGNSNLSVCPTHAKEFMRPIISPHVSKLEELLDEKFEDWKN